MMTVVGSSEPGLAPKQESRVDVLGELEGGLRSVIERLDPEVRKAVGYHFGFVELDGSPAPGALGKCLRPRLAVLGAEACGLDPAAAFPAALAIELVHNFSLVHDDMMDEDPLRRHRPTLWAAKGPSTALLAGDALLVLALQVLLEDPGEGTASAGQRLATATAEMIAGQSLDGSLERAPFAVTTLDKVKQMARAKTGALLSCACCLGATLLSAPKPLQDALSDYGMRVGLAFQAVDDLLGLWGDPHVTGKPVGSDVARGKKTIPVALALDSLRDDPRNFAKLANLLEKSRRNAEEATKALAALEELGTREMTLALARQEILAAQTALDSPGFEDPAREELVKLADSMVDREF
jgi:geranylgeranyl diphosphate synthase type I